MKEGNECRKYGEGTEYRYLEKIYKKTQERKNRRRVEREINIKHKKRIMEGNGGLKKTKKN